MPPYNRRGERQARAIPELGLVAPSHTANVAGFDLPSARRDEFLDLMRQVYGIAMSGDEFDWFFDRNPAGDRLLSAVEDGGRVAGVLAMSYARAVVDGREALVAFAVHAVTHPSARGKGIFSNLALRNEELAATAGATLALGFANPMSGPILVGRLGWQDLYRMRLWARMLRPLRALRRRGGGGLPPTRGGTLARFGNAQEAAWRGELNRLGNCLVRDASYLNWRYVDTPKEYRCFASAKGYAVVGHAVHKNMSAAVICDLVGPARETRALLRRCLSEARGGADVAIGVPAPGQRTVFLMRGFVPTPITIRVIGKPLSADARLPDGWHFAPGDTDFF
jgi:GNAT superfamily N-acetyltransferase